MTKPRDTAAELRNERFLWRLAALAGLYIMLDSLLDLAVGVAPAQWGSNVWRFGAAGLAAGQAGSIVFGQLLLVLAFLRLEHKGLMRTAAVFALLAAVVTLVVAPLFGLDALQMWPAVRPQAAKPVALATVRAGLTFGCFFLFNAWLGVALLRLVRAMTSREEPLPLVGGARRAQEEGA